METGDSTEKADITKTTDFDFVTERRDNLARSRKFNPTSRAMETPSRCASSISAPAPQTQPVHQSHERICQKDVANVEDLHSEASAPSSDTETAPAWISEKIHGCRATELHQYLASPTRPVSPDTRCEVRSLRPSSASTPGPSVEKRAQQHEVFVLPRSLPDDFWDSISVPTTPCPLVEHGRDRCGEEEQSWMSIAQLCWRCFVFSPDPEYPCNAVFASVGDLRHHHIGRHCYFHCKICYKFDRIQYRDQHLERHKDGLPSLDECFVCGDRFDPTKTHGCYEDTFVATDTPPTSNALGLGIGF